MTNRLANAIASTYKLTPDEAKRLDGTTLSQLSQQARTLVANRTADQPVALVGSGYDGGGVAVGSGKEAVRDAMEAYFGQQRGHTRLDHFDEDPDQRSERINNRLRGEDY